MTTLKALNPTPAQLNVVRCIVGGALFAYIAKLNEKSAANSQVLLETLAEFAADSYLTFNDVDVSFWEEVVSAYKASTENSNGV